MKFQVVGYLVSTGSYNTAVGLPDFFFLEIGAPTDVILEADDRFLDPLDPGAVSVTIGDDEQGPITSIEYRDWIREEGSETVTYSFVRLERDATADFVLLPVDPVTGQLITQPLPAASDYEAGDTFDPVAIGPLANSAPLAAVDASNVDEDDSVTIDVLEGATDADGDGSICIKVPNPPQDLAVAFAACFPVCRLEQIMRAEAHLAFNLAPLIQRRHALRYAVDQNVSVMDRGSTI